MSLSTLTSRIRFGLICLIAIAMLTSIVAVAERNPIVNPRPSPRVEYLSDFQYITNFELSRFNERIWFWAPDTLRGPVHSNEMIGINGGVFYDIVSTSASSMIGNVNAAQFFRGIRLNMPPVLFPERADAIRNAAARHCGVWLPSDGTTITGLQFDRNVVTLWRWPIDATTIPYGDPARAIATFAIPEADYAIFCDGELWLKGNVNRRVAIGAEGNIRLMDNLYYSETEPYFTPSSWGRLPDWNRNQSPSPMLTVVSEAINGIAPQTLSKGILIANTDANGREQGRDQSSGNHNRSHIVLMGSYVALQGEFTFEDQNDVWNSYVSPVNGNDERGTIYLYGNVAQNRRGYVHRSNHNGTGYAKAYVYDNRFRTVQPPFVPEAPRDRSRIR